MNSEKHILLITYYWPPAGGAGVHRWLRFSKFFKPNGCKLTVFCPKNAAWAETDQALLKDVHNDINLIERKIFEPHKYLGNTAGTGFTETSEPSLLKRLTIWIRGNLFIPDSRVFWIRPSVRFLKRYLAEHPEIKTIVTTGPPHSAHVIGLKIKAKLGDEIRWVADFRDPWTQIDFYQNLKIGKRADVKQKRLERMCLTQADEVITVSPSCAVGLEEICSRKVHVITNGYDFPEFDERLIELDEKFTIAHFGSMPYARNPLALWKAIRAILNENQEFGKHLKINLIGTVDYKVIESFSSFDLATYIQQTPLLPHSQSIHLQRGSQLLLLVANNTGNVKGILTGKFFEYLGARRPILALGALESDLSKAMENTQCGHFSEIEDVHGVKEYILACYSKFLAKELYIRPINIENYNSENLAKSMIEFL